MKWTDEQIESLKKLCYEGKSNAEIATIFNCKKSDVYAKRSQLGITIDKCKAVQQQTKAKKPLPIYGDTEKALEGLIKTIYTALNSRQITVEESRILSNLVTALQGARGLFLEAIEKGE